MTEKESLLIRLKDAKGEFDALYNILSDLLEAEKAEIKADVPKIKYIRPIPGWCGMKLKGEVSNDGKDWEPVGLIAVDERGAAKFRYVTLYQNWMYFRCPEFSPANPPPIDWLVEIAGIGKRHFAGFDERRQVKYWAEGRTSRTSGKGETYCVEQRIFRFLDIEKVPDDDNKNDE